MFETAGLRANTALLNSIGIGHVNMVSRLLGLYLIDRLSTKVLLCTSGLFSCIIAQPGFLRLLYELAWHAGAHFSSVFGSRHGAGDSDMGIYFEIFPQSSAVRIIRWAVLPTGYRRL